MWMVLKCSLRMVQIIKAADNKGMTCLHFARSETMVKFLITNGAVVNSLSTDQTTPLHYASK